jgi:hypothetical protein
MVSFCRAYIMESSKSYQFNPELLESYLNGSRTLSNERLSYLIVSQPGQSSNHLPHAGEHSGLADYELFICAAHFLGDGMALHSFASDFFCLLGNGKSELELEVILRDEFQARGSIVDSVGDQFM